MYRLSSLDTFAVHFQRKVPDQRGIPISGEKEERNPNDVLTIFNFENQKPHHQTISTHASNGVFTQVDSKICFIFHNDKPSTQ